MATIDYDNIQLNLTSAFNDKGAEEAIDNLGDIKKGLDNLDSGNVKEAAQDFRDFADAVNSVSTRSLDDIVKGAIKRANIPRASSLTDEEIENGRTIEWSGETSSAIESAKELNQALVDVQENARTAYDDLYAYLSAYPKTSQSYLKNQMGFDDDTIAHVRQDLYIASVNAKETASGVGQIGKEAKKSLSPIEKIAQRLKNLVIYRILRSIVSGMANAIKEGFSNLESWDRSIGMTGFAESMDRARASLTVLKNSLAVVGAPFLEGLVNILQRVAQLAMVAANAISRFFAILGGKSSYRAVKWADSIAASQSKAGSSAKKATAEFKKQLMAFDEINNITAPSDGGSGGGGGGGISAGLTEMFEELEVGDLNKIEQAMAKIGEKVREWNKDFLTANQRIDETSDKFNKFFKIDGVVKKVQQAIANYNKELKNYGSNIDETSDKFNKFFGLDKIAEKIRQAYVTVGEIVVGSFQKMIIYSQMAKDIALAYAEALVKGMQLAFGTLKVFLQGGDWKTYWKEGMDQIKTDLDTKVTGAVQTAKENLDKTFNKKYDLQVETGNATTTVNNAVEAAKRALNSLNGYKPHISINVTENVTRYVHELFTGKSGKFASGGFPTQGQMFIAREAGPELVGTIGGQTAVVNNSDIVASVSQGVAQAVASVLGGGQQVNVTLEGDAKNLFKVVQREGRAYSARTGQPALA